MRQLSIGNRYTASAVFAVRVAVVDLPNMRSRSILHLVNLAHRLQCTTPEVAPLVFGAAFAQKAHPEQFATLVLARAPLRCSVALGARPSCLTSGQFCLLVAALALSTLAEQ